METNLGSEHGLRPLNMVRHYDPGYDYQLGSVVKVEKKHDNNDYQMGSVVKVEKKHDSNDYQLGSVVKAHLSASMIPSRAHFIALLIYIRTYVYFDGTLGWILVVNGDPSSPLTWLKAA